jgi:hypothetical protein
MPPRTTEDELLEAEQCLVLNKFVEAEEKATHVLKRCQYLPDGDSRTTYCDRAAVVLCQALHETNRYARHPTLHGNHIPRRAMHQQCTVSLVLQV